MAQEAVLKTIIALANDQVDMQRFDPWFYTVVRNVARDWHRLHGRDVPLPEAHEPEDARVDTEIKQLLDGQEVEVLLASLEPQERLVLN
jgi:DNA-directed RNA polymerase specialized sigma24 family protein